MSVVSQPVRESSRIWMKFCLSSCLEFLQGFGNPSAPPESPFVVLQWAVHREGQIETRARPHLVTVKRELA